jgi:hypothetical protein
VLAATDRGIMTFEELHDLDESAGALADRVIENLMRQSAEEPEMRDAALTPDRRAALAAVHEAERVKMRARAWDAILEGSLAVQTADLPESVRRAALAVVCAHEDECSDAARNEIENDFEVVIEGAVAELVNAGLRDASREEVGGALDSLPARRA